MKKPKYTLLDFAAHQHEARPTAALLTIANELDNINTTLNQLLQKKKCTCHE